MGGAQHSNNVSSSIENNTIRNSAHRKPSTVLYNSSSGTTVSAAVNVQHTSIHGVSEVVLYFAQLYYNVTFNSHNSQLILHTDLHASYIVAVRGEERAIIGVKSNLLYSEIVKFQI
jgi:hypothetical protein